MVERLKGMDASAGLAGDTTPGSLQIRNDSFEPHLSTATPEMYVALALGFGA
jgi:hypothetical protein